MTIHYTRVFGVPRPYVAPSGYAERPTEHMPRHIDWALVAEYIREYDQP